jgi:hypothetical protein
MFPPPAVLNRVLELKDYTSICSSAPSEILGLMAVRAWGPVVEGQMAIIRHNLEVMERFARRWGQVLEWRRPQAGTMAFLRLLKGGMCGWGESKHANGLSML